MDDDAIDDDHCQDPFQLSPVVDDKMKARKQNQGLTSDHADPTDVDKDITSIAVYVLEYQGKVKDGEHGRSARCEYQTIEVASGATLESYENGNEELKAIIKCDAGKGDGQRSHCEGLRRPI
jgi:hypothetical protein